MAQLRWVFGRGRLIRDANGKPVRYSGVDVDVTEQRMSEAALRESQDRFRRVFEQSPLGKATLGRDFRLREVNPALCRMLGYATGELVGRNLLDIVHPDHRDKCYAQGQALLDGTQTLGPAGRTLRPQVRRTVLGQRECRPDPRRRRQRAVHARHHRGHRRAQTDPRGAAGQRAAAARADRAAGAGGRTARPAAGVQPSAAAGVLRQFAGLADPAARAAGRAHRICRSQSGLRDRLRP